MGGKIVFWKGNKKSSYKGDFEELCIRLEDKIKKNDADISMLERIIHYNKQGQITYHSYDPYEDSRLILLGLSDGNRKITDIYKDNVEYRIEGLLLHDAEIDQIGLCNGVIHITDKCEGTQVSYLVDLNNKTFIRKN